MNDPRLSGDAPPTVEQGLAALVDDAKECLSKRYHECEKRIARSPAQAVLIAVAAGYMLHRLPIRALLVAKVRLVSALAPPALFAFGAAKVCEYLQNEARKRP